MQDMPDVLGDALKENKIMPYIKRQDRTRLNGALSLISGIPDKGELEYSIFYLMKVYMATRGYRYTELHNCVYAAHHCADEFRRRFLDKREDEALKENGDILVSEPVLQMSDNDIAAEELAKDKFLSQPISEE